MWLACTAVRHLHRRTQRAALLPSGVRRLIATPCRAATALRCLQLPLAVAGTSRADPHDATPRRTPPCTPARLTKPIFTPRTPSQAAPVGPQQAPAQPDRQPHDGAAGRTGGHVALRGEPAAVRHCWAAVNGGLLGWSGAGEGRSCGYEGLLPLLHLRVFLMVWVAALAAVR